MHIQIIIRMLYHNFETLLLFSFFYLMVKSGKSFVKIGYRFQLAPFLFILSKFPPLTRSFRPPPLPTYLILPNVPTSPLIRTSRLFGTLILLVTRKICFPLKLITASLKALFCIHYHRMEQIRFEYSLLCFS